MAASSTKSTAAEAEAVGVAEAPAAAPKRMFQWSGEDGQEISLVIPRRIKRGKVARCIAREDLSGALDLIFTPDEVEAIEDLDLTPEEWEDFQTRLWEDISGTSPKTS